MDGKLQSNDIVLFRYADILLMKAEAKVRNFSYVDRFDSPTLDMRWMYLRNPDLSAYNVGSNGLSIKASDANIHQVKPITAVFRRQQHNTFTAETEVMFTPANDKELAGFALLQNEQYNFTFGKTKVGGRTAIVLTRAEKNNVVIGSKFLCEKCADKPVRLRIHGDGRSYVYQAMRVTGAGDIYKPVAETLQGKLPQCVITKKAAHGYSSYGNQIGLYIHR